jgi:hypothetical protein
MPQTIALRVWDVTSSRSTEVQAPDDVPVGRLLVILVERMKLPIHSPDGQIMSYKLHHKRTGRQLLDNQTLAEGDVQSGDDVRLQPEITAGLSTALKAGRRAPLRPGRAT